MVIRVLRAAEQVAVAAADIVTSVLADRGDVRLGVATGTTPLPLYRELVRRHDAGSLRTDGLALFLLDEYLGLDRDDPRAFASVVRDHLARPLGLPERAVHAPDVHAPDLDEACRRFDEVRDDRDIDLQILGIGGNGHIAFNEPGSPVGSRCRVVGLTDRTRADNRLGAHDPTHAATIGIGSILRARRLLLLATGAPKAEALARTLARDPGAPAAALLDHPDLTILADQAAATRLGDRVDAGKGPA